MIMKIFKFIFLLCGFLILPLYANAQDQMMVKPSIEIQAPYAFATISTAPTGAVFFTIVNNSNQDDMLIEAKSDVAEFTEIHQNYIDEDDGTMMMRKIPNIPVTAGGQATLKPAGYHIMLIKLKEQLLLEDSFPVTLVFEKAGEIIVAVNIIPPGTQPIESLHNAHDKIEEIILKMDSEKVPDIDHSQMDHSDHQSAATGDAVNLLKPRVPNDLGQSNIQAKPDQVNRVLLEDGSEYVEDINLENLDIENFE